MALRRFFTAAAATTTIATFLVVWAISLVVSAAAAAAAAAIPEKLPPEIDCSICADGSLPTVPETTIFPISSTVSLNCSASSLPTNAIASIYKQGITNTDYQCAISQLWAYQYCGCPTAPTVARECWICKDGDISYNEDIWVPSSSSAPEGTCQFQAIMSGLRYDFFGRANDAPELKCPHMTWGMDTWCGCPAATVSLPACTLCKDYTTSAQKCKRNPLAIKLHTTQSPLGINFGTCQYYDWLVERLNVVQCGIFDIDSTIQFDGFDVKGFCCTNDQSAAVVSGVTLCPVGTGTLAANKYIPALRATCQEVSEAAPYLVNETTLVEPWDDLLPTTDPATTTTSAPAPLSLRDYCCTSNGVAETQQQQQQQQQQQPQGGVCEPIPRIEYDARSTSSTDPSSSSSSSLFFLMMICIILIKAATLY